VSKSDFIKICKELFENRGVEVFNGIVDIIQATAKEALPAMMGDDNPAPEEVDQLLNADYKKIFAQFFTIFNCQSQQIYEAYFKVFKLGNTTEKLNKKTVDAFCAVVLGDVELKDRPKMVFDAFDHNGDGKFAKDELKAYLGAIAGYMQAFAHCAATAYTTFGVNHSLPAAMTVAFSVLAEDGKEMKIENCWMAMPDAHRDSQPIGMLIKAKFGKSKEDVKAFQQTLEQKVKGGDEEISKDKMGFRLMSKFVQELIATC